MIATFLDSLAADFQFAAAVQSLFLSLFLGGRKGARDAGALFLAGAAFVFALCMADDFLTTNGFYQGMPALAGSAGNLLPSLIGPLIFLHIQAQVRPVPLRPGQIMRHGACFLVLLVLTLPALAFPAKSDPNTRDIAGNYLTLLILVNYFVTTAQGIYYLRSSFALVFRDQSNHVVASAYLAWLRILLQAAIFLWFLYFVSFGLQLYGRPQPVINVLFSFGYLGILYGLTWTSLRNPQASLRPPGEVVRVLVEHLPKYKKSAQTSSDARRIIGKLDALMRDEELFRQEGLTLIGLAQKVGASTNAVSQALNQHLGQSFTDYVNRHRIDSAKRLLTNATDEVQTILDVAYAVGFTSKSTFNTAFRKFAGMTPTEWKQQSPAEEERSDL